jgi:hypothetical protein
MTVQQESDSFRARIARAEVERDAWRTAGNEEKYLEAYFLVEALELQFARHANQAVVNPGVA